MDGRPVDLTRARREAKALLRAARAGDAAARARMGPGPAGAAAAAADAQLAVARELGARSWPALVRDAQARDRGERARTFVEWATSARREDAEALLALDPALGRQGLDAALVLGDAEPVRAALAGDPGVARRAFGARGWEPLLYVTHSAFLGGERSDGLVACARLLLAAGADPDDGRSLRAAAGAEDPACLELLLEAGARVQRRDGPRARRPARKAGDGAGAARARPDAVGRARERAALGGPRRRVGRHAAVAGRARRRPRGVVRRQRPHALRPRRAQWPARPRRAARLAGRGAPRRAARRAARRLRGRRRRERAAPGGREPRALRGCCARPRRASWPAGRPAAAASRGDPARPRGGGRRARARRPHRAAGGHRARGRRPRRAARSQRGADPASARPTTRRVADEPPYGELGWAAERAYLRLLATSPLAESRPCGDGLAVLTGVDSNSENGVVCSRIDRRRRRDDRRRRWAGSPSATRRRSGCSPTRSSRPTCASAWSRPARAPSAPQWSSAPCSTASRSTIRRRPGSRSRPCATPPRCARGRASSSRPSRGRARSRCSRASASAPTRRCSIASPVATAR